MNKNNGNKFSPGSTRAGCASSAGASRGQLGGNWGHPTTDGAYDELAVQVMTIRAAIGATHDLAQSVAQSGPPMIYAFADV